MKKNELYFLKKKDGKVLVKSPVSPDFKEATNVKRIKKVKNASKQPKKSNDKIMLAALVAAGYIYMKEKGSIEEQLQKIMASLGGGGGAGGSFSFDLGALAGPDTWPYLQMPDLRGLIPEMPDLAEMMDTKINEALGNVAEPFERLAGGATETAREISGSVSRPIEASTNLLQAVPGAVTAAGTGYLGYKVATSGAAKAGGHALSAAGKKIIVKGAPIAAKAAAKYAPPLALSIVPFSKWRVKPSNDYEQFLGNVASSPLGQIGSGIAETVARATGDTKRADRIKRSARQYGFDKPGANIPNIGKTIGGIVKSIFG